MDIDMDEGGRARRGRRSDWGEPRVKQVAWYDPRVTARGALQVAGRAFLEGIVAGRLPPPPIADLLGFALVRVGDGAAHIRGTPDESVYNPLGLVHGGWLCALLDSAAGCAVQTRLPAGVHCATIEIKVSFLKAVQAQQGAIEVIGRAVRVGRRVAFAEAHAHDAQGDLVGQATTSLAILGAHDG